MTAETATKPLPKIDRLSDRIDKSAYIGFIIVGVVGIIYGRLNGFDPFDVVLVPAGLIILYALLALFTKRFQLREDRVADNCYYMGFMFTLVSLAYALYTFRFGGAVTEQLIQDFGIALGSTIVGVGARLLLNQLRSDPVEIERDARLDLANASTRLKAELLSALNDFQSYRTALHQSLEEAQEAARARTEEALDTTAHRFGEIANAVVTEVNETFKIHQQNAKKLTAASSKTVTALESLVERLEEIEAPADLVSKRLAPAVAEIERAAEAVRKRAEAEGLQVKGLKDMIEAALGSAEALDERLKAEGADVKALRDLVSGLTDTTSTLSESVTALTENARQAQSALTDTASALSESVTALIENARQAHSTLSEMGGSSTSGAAALREEMARTLEALKAHNAALANQVERGREMTKKVQDSLISLSDDIVRKLEVPDGSQARSEARAS